MPELQKAVLVTNEPTSDDPCVPRLKIMFDDRPYWVALCDGEGQRDYLRDKLKQYSPFDLVLVCGKVAQDTINLGDTRGARCLFLPHPAARQWTRRGLSLVGRLVRDGKRDYEVTFDRRSPSGLSIRKLIPF